MAAYLLPGGTSHDPIHEIAAKEQWFRVLVSAGVVTEPVLLAPPVFGADYVGMLDAVHSLAALKEEMADNTPGGGNTKLFEQGKQAVDHDFSFNPTGRPKSPRPEQVKRSPNQLEVEAYCQDSRRRCV